MKQRVVAFLGRIVILSTLTLGSLTLAGGIGYAVYLLGYTIASPPKNYSQVKPAYVQPTLVPTPIPKPVVFAPTPTPTPSTPMVRIKRLNGAEEVVPETMLVSLVWIDGKTYRVHVDDYPEYLRKKQEYYKVKGAVDEFVGAFKEATEQQEAYIEAYKQTESSGGDYSQSSGGTEYVYQEPEPSEETKAYCARELTERKQGAHNKYGSSTSTYFGIVEIFENQCYPKCLSTGSWPSDCNY